MTNRWKRTCAAVCAAVLLIAQAGAAEETIPVDAASQTQTETADGATGAQSETAEAVPDAQAETPAEEQEQVIDFGTLPESIEKLLETAAQEIGYTEESNGYNKYGVLFCGP